MPGDPEVEAWDAIATLLLAVEVDLDGVARRLGLTAKALRHLGAAGVVLGGEDVLVADCATLALRLRQLGQRLGRAVESAKGG